MIVVVSTSKDAVGLAGRCVSSVARQGPNVRDHTVWHYYQATDGPTAEDARAAAAGSRRAIITVDPGLALPKACKLWEPLAPDTIVVWLDGDDELVDGALERVALLYERSDVWATYGSFIRDDGRLDWLEYAAYGRRYIGNPRREVWRASHLKTFRAGLVNSIPKPYLVQPDGTPYEWCLDLVVMWALLELAGERYAVSTEVNAIYNSRHSAVARDPRARDLEIIVAKELRARTPLEPLTERPW